MKNTCTSCGRKFDGEGVYCGDCLDKNGKLKPFEEVRKSLGLNIARSQGYAEEPACEIAESILQQQPAWKKRFEKIDKKKRTTKRNKKIKKWSIGISTFLAIGMIIFGGLYYAGIIRFLNPTVIYEGDYSELHGANNKYLFFTKIISSEDETKRDRECLYKMKLSTKEITPISSETDAKVFSRLGWQSLVNDKYVVWADGRFATEENYGYDMFVSDFKDDERRITTDTLLRMPFKLSGDWIIYIEYDVDFLNVEIFAHNLSNPKNTPVKIVELLKQNDGTLDVNTFDGETYLVYVEKINDKKTLTIHNLDTNKKTNVISHSKLSGLTVLHHQKKLFYAIDIEEYDRTTKKKLLRPKKQKLVVYDIETKKAKTIGTYYSIYRIADMIDNYFIFGSLGHQGRQIYEDENGKRSVEFENNKKGHSNSYIYDMETQKVKVTDLFDSTGFSYTENGGNNRYSAFVESFSLKSGSAFYLFDSRDMLLREIIPNKKYNFFSFVFSKYVLYYGLQEYINKKNTEYTINRIVLR